MTESSRRDPRALLKTGFRKFLTGQYPVARENVTRLRRVHPDWSPAEMVSHLNAMYLGTVTMTGAGAGAAAIVPNVWVQGPVALADLASFLEASVLYALSVAEIHDIDVEDFERRQFLVMSVLVGNSAASSVLEPLVGRTAPYWGKKIVQSIPMATIDAANKILGPRFITKYGTKQGVLVLGKQVPMLIGVGIGAGGNHVFGWFVIGAARKILGPAPEHWAS